MDRFESDFGRSRLYPLANIGMAVFFALLVAENFGADLPLGLKIAQLIAAAVGIGTYVVELGFFFARRGPYRSGGPAGPT